MSLSNWEGRTAFLAGMLGGSSPFTLRMALGLVNQDHKAILAVKDPGWILGVLVLGLIGGAVAAVWKEKDARKAFQLGVGLPSLLTVFNAGASAPLKVSFNPLIHPSTVYAAARPVSGRKLKIVVPSEVSGSSINAIFDATSSQTAVPFKANTEIEVPSGARTVEFKSDLFESESVELPAQPNVLIVVTFENADKKLLYGFLYSIGIQSHPYRLRQPKVAIIPRN